MYSYKNVVCVTNRHLASGEFLERVEKIANKKPEMIIVREKDLSEAEYEKLFESVRSICQKHSVRCIPHFFIDAAERLSEKTVHLPLWKAEENIERLGNFSSFGVSVHSREDALKASQLGAEYVICGHVFETDCKKGLEPRGLDFVRGVRSAFDGKVYAIGGIDFSNMDSVLKAGADGVCMMSSLMRSKTL